MLGSRARASASRTTDHATATTTVANAAATTAAGADSAPPPALKIARLLQVDDEPQLQSAPRRLFRLQGHDIEQATSGAEARALLTEKPFDLVISDMRRPEIDRAALLEIVRERHPGIMRMRLTGYAYIRSTVAAIDRGENHRHIAKPRTDDGLPRLVSEALSRRQLQLQNAGLKQLTLQQNRALHNLNHELQVRNKTRESRVASRTAELGQVNALLAQSPAGFKPIHDGDDGVHGPAGDRPDRRGRPRAPGGRPVEPHGPAAEHGIQRAAGRCKPRLVA